jgi:hypothetical protein
MANHVLSLEVPDVMNTCIIKIFDTSIYATGMPVVCPKVDITVPGFVYASEIAVTPGFNLTITACDLGLQTTGCDTSNYANLPDGIYIIKYSVSPNEYVYAEYNYLRITQAMIKYQKVLCEIDVADCEPPANIKEKLNKLTMIKQYLEAAKNKVEICHEPDKGMRLYKYAMKLLNKMNCTNC